MPRENFFILLDLPTNENNLTKIDAVIKQKQSEWSKLRNHPTKGRIAQQYLDLLPEIKRVMHDNNLRQAEAWEAEKFGEKKLKNQFKDLDEYLKILSAKGKLFEGELYKLAQTFPMLPEIEIRRRIKVPVVKEDKLKFKQTKQLDQTTLKVISDSLAMVGKASLYEFLGLSPTSSLKTLQKRIQEQDQTNKKVAQKNAMLGANNMLIGQCQTIFSTKEMREAYDASLLQQRLVSLDKAIEVACWSGRVQPQEYELLFKKAIMLGLDKKNAREYILEACQKKNCSIEIGTSAPSLDNLQSCGRCGFLNLAKARNCEQCGNPLETRCPQCNTSNASSVQFCRKCGFAVGDMPNALPLLHQAKIALTQQDLNLANQLLQQAKIYWPAHPDIIATLQTVQSEIQAVDKVVQELHTLMNQNYFYQARQTIAQLRQLDQSHAELSNEAMINQKIAAAERCLQTAQRVTKENDLIEAYSAALLEVKDCQIAIEAMAKLPPEPSAQLNVSDSAHAISLHWLPSTSKGNLTYRVIRNLTHFPYHSQDGKILGEIPQTQLEDPNLEAGQEYYYAIYTIRGPILSQQAAQKGPVMHIAEIDALQIMPGDGCINLSWKMPPKALTVEVWRQENEVPQNRGDGHNVVGVRWDGLTDVGLHNDTLYAYLIILIFEDAKRNKYYSKGITCQARPLELPPPVNDLHIVQQKDHLNISWTPPPKAAVDLFYTEKPIHFTAGESLPIKRLGELAKPITVQKLGHLKWPINFQGVIYIVPVTVSGEIAVIGTVQKVTTINEVNNLHGQVSYNQLYLEWDWPAGAQQALVAYRHDKYPQHYQDSEAMCQYISKSIYAEASAFVIHQPANNNYYFTVFIMAGESEKAIYSKGTSCCVAKSGYQEIFYEIKTKKGLLGKRYALQLILKTEGHNITMPQAVLVTKVGDLPLRRADGQIIYTVPEIHIQKKMVINIPYQESQKNSYIKLFLTDRTKEQNYRLVAPKKNKLILR